MGDRVFVGSTPHPGCQSPPGWHSIFRFGNPNTKTFMAATMASFFSGVWQVSFRESTKLLPRKLTFCWRTTSYWKLRWVWSMTHVAPRIVNNVPSVKRINDECYFSWQVQYLVIFPASHRGNLMGFPLRSTHETVLAMLEARCDPNPPHRGVAWVTEEFPPQGGWEGLVQCWSIFIWKISGKHMPN